jgi:hypothetical protein
MTNVTTPKLMERFSESLFERDLHNCSLSEIEKSFATIAKHHGLNMEFTDILFQLNESKERPIEHIDSENAIVLFIDLLHKYENKLASKPEQWEFLLFYPSYDCHEHFIGVYGEDYFNQIINPSGENFTHYHQEHFKKLYLEGKLDKFLKVENMKNMYDNSSLSMLHALAFFDADRENFKSFMQEQFTNDLAADLSSISSNFLQYNRLIGRLQVTSNNLAKGVILKVPSKYETDILIEKWGIDKTSQVISEYMNYQKEYMTQPGILNKYPIKFDEDKLVDLITKKIQFINCGSALSFGLERNIELLSYFIINGAIKQEDLLSNIKNKHLHTEANYLLLNSSLGKNDVLSTGKKLKL